MIRRQPRSTRTDTRFPTRRASDLADALKALLGKDLIAHDFAVGEDSITVRRDAIAGVMVQLRDALDYQQLMEIAGRSEEHTSELQSLMRISYAVFCLKKKKKKRSKLRLSSSCN